MLTLLAALVHHPLPFARLGSGTVAAIPIALLAFAGSVQLTAVSVLDVAPELNTAMLTGTLIRLGSGDMRGRQSTNAQRLRVLACVCLMFGCFVGAVAQRRGGVRRGAMLRHAR